MTTQQILDKTEELTQAIKDQPTEVLVDMWENMQDEFCSYSWMVRHSIRSIIMSEIQSRFPDEYDKWADSDDTSMKCFLDCQQGT